MASGNETKNSETPAINTTADEKNLVVSFIQFLRQKVAAKGCSPDEAEGIEVAIQCLETAFQIDDSNFLFQPSKPLLETFIATEGLPSGLTNAPEPSEFEIREANRLKEEGNGLMKSSQFDAAIAKYTEAIKLNKDPAYFCNRAAAYCRLEQYDLAIQDCRAALALDSSYSKAYGRMGLALSCQTRYEQAIEAYKKALELDPTQESYSNNLKIAEDKLAEARNAVGAAAGGMGPAMFGGQMPDINAFMSNPNMINLATQLMTDPGIQNLMSQMMGGMMGGSGGGGGGGGGGGATTGVNDLIQAGQQLAQQMQSANPELVEQLRNQFQQNQGGPNERNPQNEGGNS